MRPPCRHWSERYVGLAYAEANCAQLGRRVLLEQFGLELDLPAWDGADRTAARLIGAHLPTYASPTLAPADGDGVLMLQGSRLWHVGIYASPDGQPCVLHSLKRCGAVLTRIARLPALGYALEGYYRWRR